MIESEADLRAAPAMAGFEGTRARMKKQGAKAPGAPERLQLAAIGMEAEFCLLLDGRPVRPEQLFGSPRAFLSGPLMHRTGTSYHLPTGGAVYFDTGVIEVTTPVIEIERGCAARAGRSLWEGIRVLRSALDRWQRRHDHEVRLVGFSAHYNISFELPRTAQRDGRTVEALSLLLAYILPFPVMLLAANRRSTGIGVRPRGDRVEITADFTPSAPLMVATATLLTGIVREVMTWPSFELSMLGRAGLPVVEGYHPIPHTTRHGWLARYNAFPQNPFTADVDAPIWPTTDGRMLSLRTIAGLTTRHFWRPIRRISDPFTYRLIGSVMRGRSPSLLDLPDRPDAYEDVGHLCRWDDLFPERTLPRSRYERVLMCSIAGQKLRMHGTCYTPVAMNGWSQVVFRRDDRGTRHTFPIDYLLRHLGEWESGA
jgi:hypothetical protein